MTVADFEAFVLTGGKSERMGRDKAFIVMDGDAMVVRVCRALERAGASRVICVGGDRDALSALGLIAIADDFEGAGPLGGVLAALRTSAAPVTVVTPCDLLAPRAEAFVKLMTALERTPDARVTVPVIDGAWRPLPCALRVGALEELERVFARGERAVHRALAGLERVEVDAGSFDDADSPGDLPGHG
jgi:molybdopterin-guanine dinucleotide biosynthesis protein A